MSRGLGSRQRAVMNAIDVLGGAASVIDLAEHIEGEPVEIGGPTYESIRRALQTLVGRGLLQPFQGPRGRAIRYRVEYTDGSIGGHKRFGRPSTVAAHDQRLKRFF